MQAYKSVRCMHDGINGRINTWRDPGSNSRSKWTPSSHRRNCVHGPHPAGTFALEPPSQARVVPARRGCLHSSHRHNPVHVPRRQGHLPAQPPTIHGEYPGCTRVPGGRRNNLQAHNKYAFRVSFSPNLFPGLVSSLPGILCDFEWFLWDSKIFKVDLV